MTKKNDGYHLVTVRMPMPMVEWLDAETRTRKPGRDELNTPMSRGRVVRDCVAAAMESGDKKITPETGTWKSQERPEADA